MTDGPKSEMCDLKAQLSGLRYLIYVPVPHYRDRAGRIHLDKLWALDLQRHLDYLSDLTVLAPFFDLPESGQENGSNTGLVDVVDSIVCWVDLPPGLRFEALPAASSSIRGLLQFPKVACASIAAVRRADIVHSGALGAPIPPGLIINPLAVMTGKPLVIAIESTFWRGGGVKRRLRARLRGMMHEGLLRWSSRKASLLICTHQDYADDYGKRTRGRVLVTPASWIDTSDILTESEALSVWSTKPDLPRFLLAARLIDGKGIGVLLKALELAEKQSLSISVDIIGEGPMRKEALELSARLKIASLRVLDPVPYGPLFRALVRNYHAVLVPTLTIEQPRIIYDAFAQAVPVIASDTPGHREAVFSGKTGLLVRTNDPADLLAKLKTAHPEQLQQFGMSAREWVGGRTHQAMHLARARIMAEAFT
jgi:glycosyltransferase involved in cell wall biosynthesis